MRRAAALFSILIAVFMILLGLLFLAGSAGQLRRVVIGVAGLGLGGVLAGTGVATLKRLEKESPEYIRAEVMALAKRRNGEISHEDLAATLGRRLAFSEPVMAALLTEGVCTRQAAEGSIFYTFPELQPRLMILRCAYCSTEFELVKGLDKCPNCAGPIEAKVASVSLSEGEVFHMDEEES
jgi:hypothetical protein